MSKESDPDQTVQKIVVFFDICSSTTVLEDLLASGNLRRWRNLLIALKKFLAKEARAFPFIPYKFQGDGWILLFDSHQTEGTALLELLRKLCTRYAELFSERISPVLSTGNCVTGLTMGIDAGTLVKIVMLEHDEYVGRPLNVASRLQGAIKVLNRSPAGKLLISKPAYVALGLRHVGVHTREVTCSLRNISNGSNYLAMKIVIHRT